MRVVPRRTVVGDIFLLFIKLTAHVLTEKTRMHCFMFLLLNIYVYTFVSFAISMSMSRIPLQRGQERVTSG